MWLDDLIGYFSPESKLERVKARMQSERVESFIEKKRAYDGASKGRRTDGWKSTGLSATAEIAPALPTLRNRSRELVRNNSYASRGMQVIPANVVGKGIRPAIVVPDDQALEDRLKEQWHQWAASTQCDWDGRHDYYGMQYLALRAVAESGEVLIRKRKVRRNGAVLSTKLQMLESDYIASDREMATSPAANNRVVQGIEFDPAGRKVAYHLHETHPGNYGVDLGDVGRVLRTIRVPAADILHIYRTDRPGQIRGVPWLASVMLRLKDFDDYEQAQLLRQKLAACYMAFVKDTEIPDLEQDEIELLTKFEPGVIEFLPPGKDVVLSDPPQVNENYAEYTRVMLQAVATGLGVSYEALTGNLKDINFSSSRMGWLEFQRNIETWRCNIMNVQMNDPVYEWFSEAAELEGLAASRSSVTWTAPRREMIDPAKEVPALTEAVVNRMKTLSEVIRENGKNPEDHFKELAQEKAMLDSLGLTLDTEESQNTTKPAKPEGDD